MNDAELLLTLAERCEREEPSSMLDWAIHEMAIETPGVIKPVKPYTGSLDAAMTLMPEAWTAWELRSHARKTRFSADLSRLTECDASQEDWAHGRGKTPALTLCAAALRARAAIAKTDLGAVTRPKGTGDNT